MNIRTARREPFGSAHFRIEIDGMRETGAVEVIFPEARIAVGTDGGRAVEYGTLVLKRGVTASGEWYEWWNQARHAHGELRRTASVTLMDPHGKDVRRWTFAGSEPVAYTLSKLDAMSSLPLIETLELRVGGFDSA